MNREKLHNFFMITGVLSFFTTIISLFVWIWADNPDVSWRVCITSLMMFLLCVWLDMDYRDEQKELLNNIEKSRRKSPFEQRLDELSKTRERESNSKQEGAVK